MLNLANRARIAASEAAPETQMPPSQTAIKFKQPPFMQWFWGFASIFFIGISSAGAALVARELRAHRQGMIFGLIALFFLAFGVYCARAMLRARGLVVVDEEGVWWIVGRKPPTSIAWSDIQSVRAADLMQRLIVSDRTSGRTIKIEYQLDRFVDLRAFVLAHTAASARWRPTPISVFHKSWVLVGVTLATDALILTGGVLALMQGQWVPGLFFLGFVGWLVAAAQNAPLRVTVSKDRVEIFYLLRRKIFPIVQIAAVTLVDRTSPNGNSRTDVVLSTKRQGDIKLTLFSEGCLALLQALQDAIDRAPKELPAAGS